jgi:hypothetical protein
MARVAYQKHERHTGTLGVPVDQPISTQISVTRAFGLIGTTVLTPSSRHLQLGTTAHCYDPRM